MKKDTVAGTQSGKPPPPGPAAAAVTRAGSRRSSADGSSQEPPAAVNRAMPTAAASGPTGSGRDKPHQPAADGAAMTVDVSTMTSVMETMMARLFEKQNKDLLGKLQQVVGSHGSRLEAVELQVQEIMSVLKGQSAPGSGTSFSQSQGWAAVARRGMATTSGINTADQGGTPAADVHLMLDAAARSGGHTSTSAAAPMTEVIGPSYQMSDPNCLVLDRPPVAVTPDMVRAMVADRVPDLAIDGTIAVTESRRGQAGTRSDRRVFIVRFPAHTPTCWDVRGRMWDALRDAAADIRSAHSDDQDAKRCWPDWQLSASGRDTRNSIRDVHDALRDAKRFPVWRGVELWAYPMAVVDDRKQARLPVMQQELDAMRMHHASPQPAGPIPPAGEGGEQA